MSRFDWENATELERCQEWDRWARIGGKHEAGPNVNYKCAMRTCAVRRNREIYPGEFYIQASSSKTWIAHKDCVDKRLKEHQIEQDRRNWREQEKLRLVPPRAEDAQVKKTGPLTWETQTKEYKANKILPMVERTQKKESKRMCCLCPNPIKVGDKYKQHAGHEARIAHIHCVNKYATAGDEPMEEVKQEPKMRVLPTATEMPKQIELSRYEEPKMEKKPAPAASNDELTELKIKLARLEGFKEATEMFLKKLPKMTMTEE